ncbi:hypothetical protein [Halobacillus naozhouensis]|uniref:Lipoprotein n=1 Tax=Halobacillus naozhouensis TaxID=554880 RepID=A0ABY8J370_9BACI|nr:hypothetical protein [Halobacillus naozhouensis]WFT76522.1 hypothetical protein P9989_09230 [Halobacillus naozhouensis]
MKKLIFGLLILFLTACQSSDPNASNGSNTNEEKEKYEEKPDITLSQGDKEITAKVVKECWVENCTEQSAKVGDVNLLKITNDLHPTNVTVGKDISIKVDGPKPTKMGYFVQEMELQGASLEDHSLEGNKIPLHEGGAKKFYLLSATWYNGDEFVGSISKAFILKINEK